MERVTAEVLVVGEGIAGLMAALAAQRRGASVLVIALGGGASGWLQGVNVPLGHADPRDTPAAHYEDIIREGRGISDPALVGDLVEGLAPAFFDLVGLGVEFARDHDRYRQRHASGSTYARCCFVASGMWGPVARRVLRSHLSTGGVRFERLRLVRLLTHGGRVCGAVAVRPRVGAPILVRCGATVLASGGVGNLYARSTYPGDVFGTSCAAAFRAGARISDMEFVQFEPLVVYRPQALRGFVMPTTLFGDGAVLRDRSAIRFLIESRPQGEKGIGKEDLVLAMAEVARRGRGLPRSGAVWLDARDVPRQVLEGYPWLYPVLLRRGVDLSRDLVEVLAAAHTTLGGVVVDAARRTSVGGLFAAGEAAAGTHGAGRLAGGSGSDVLVSGVRAGRSAAEDVSAPVPWPTLEDAFRETFVDEAISGIAPVPAQAALRRARTLLGRAAGILRMEPALRAAYEEIRGLFAAHEPTGPLPPGAAAWRVADALLVSGMILEGALARRESRGAHQRVDHPRTDPELAHRRLLPWRPNRPFCTDDAPAGATAAPAEPSVEVGGS